MNTKNKEMQEDIELLLPWHAAGTLSRRDAERVHQGPGVGLGAVAGGDFMLTESTDQLRA